MLDARSNDLLRGLTPAELELVVPHFRRRRYLAGQTILERGDRADALYVIESGLVSVSIPGSAGNDVTLAQLGPGQLFGEMAILTGQPRSAAIRVLVDTTVLTLSVASFFQVAGRSPTLLLNVGRVVAERLAHMNRGGSHRARRAVVALVGPVPPLVGSLVATNLAAALATMSGRRPVLLDVPSPRAAPLPGREWAPGLEEIRAGEEALLHLSELRIGALTLHTIGLPDLAGRSGVADSSGRASPLEDVGSICRAISRLARAAEFVVVNLTGAPSALVDAVLPLANVVHLVAATGMVGDDELATLARRCRRLAETHAALGVIALTGDGTSPAVVPRRMRAATGIASCAVLPSQAELMREAASVTPPMTLSAPWLAPSKVIARLARGAAGLRVGLALGGGAAKGVAHVGVVAMLNRLGVPIDVVTGTSVGAVVAAGLALGMDVKQIEESMNRLIDVWSATLRPTVSRLSLVSPRGLDRIVRDAAGDVRFEELAIPMGAVATDLNTGRAVFMFEGSVAQAIRASIGIPLVFPPVVVGEYTLVDGQVVNPVPTKLARQLGADIVLACALSGRRDEDDRAPINYREPEPGAGPSEQRASNILRTYLRCMDIMTTGDEEHDCLLADVTFRPRIPPMNWREFQKGGPLMESGEQAVEEHLDRLRELLPWLRAAG